MSACEFKFDIGDAVTIVPITSKATVLRRCDRGQGQHTYEVAWWISSMRYTDWLLESELEA